MTIGELLSNETLRQSEFPVTKSSVFLSHAGVCPLPRRVADAIADCVAASATADQESLYFPKAISRSRELAAQLLQCHSDEIALIGPTSLALSTVAAGLDLRAGDNIVLYFDDYPSNVYPWMRLAAEGVEVRRVRAPELGAITVEAVLQQVDARTRFVSLASCHFIGGLRLPVDEIGAALRERDILFCVDGIQTLGAFETSVRHADFLAADAHKWMLGPCAAGVLYVRREVQDRLKPVLVGWHNVKCPDFVAQDDLVFRSGAARYEAGTHNLLGIVGMNAAMELLLEAGVGDIGAELLRKRRLLVPALRQRGWDVLHGDAPDSTASGIVSFRRPGADMAAVHARLAQARVLTSLRMDRQQRSFIRLSPHFYNADHELARLLDLL